MPDITWQPDDRKPSDASAIEKEIERVTRGGPVRLTWAGDAWRVRALLPASMCSRGGSASGRDVSEQVEDVLLDHGCEVARVDP